MQYFYVFTRMAKKTVSLSVLPAILGHRSPGCPLFYFFVKKSEKKYSPINVVPINADTVSDWDRGPNI